MSDEVNNPEVPQTPVPEAPAASAETPAAPPTVKQMVAENLSKIGPDVRGRIVSFMTEEEIAKRVETGRKGLALQEQLQGELKRYRPDVQVFNGDGSLNEAASGWKKETLEIRKKTQEKLTIVDKALVEAFENSNFDPLNKALQKYGQGGGKNQPADEE